ncbi:MAG: hypothetical protein VB035_06125 [Candidatus Fimivivens sp.]|nr:hypothetical protein [Candidatus Fimivivens sp.]
MPRKKAPATGANNFIYRSIFRAIGEGERKSRFEISFSSETPIPIGGGASEILLHSKEAVRLTRLKEVGAVLFVHGRDPKYGRMPVAKLENIQLDETARRCTAEIVFDEADEESMALAGKVERGFINGISVGADVLKWIMLRENEMSADGRFTGPAYIAAEWEPFEVSLTPTPVDSTVGIGRSMDYENEEEQHMENNNPVTRTVGAEPAPVPTPAPAASAAGIARDAGAEERARVLAITRSCAQFGIDSVSYIERGMSVADVNADILRQLGGKHSPVSGLTVTRDEGDKYRAAAADSILMRGAIKVEKPAEGAKDLRGMTLRDLAIETLTRSGVSGANRMNGDTLFRSALSPDSAFAAILSNAVDKTMAVEYAAAQSTFERFTSKSSYVDFKPKEIYQISEAGDLEQVPQKGELKFDSMSDAKVTGQLVTFGKTFGFTRQSLINDDIGMLTKVPAAYVRASKRGINKAVYKILTSNPTMSDNKALFSADHKNLGTASVPSVAAYNEALGAMMHQKGLRGLEALNIPPKFVLCDPIQYADHATILHSTANPSTSNSGAFNPFQGMMELIMDAELFGTGTQPYYFAADPAVCGGIDVGYLNGNEQPLLESQVGFEYAGIKFRILMDYAVTLIDYRAFYKNAGV